MCQLQYIDQIGKENNWINEKLQYSIRKIRYYKRKIARSLRGNNGGAIAPLILDQLQPGDIVRIRSKDKIRLTLNQFRKTRGCTFQNGMYNDCDKQFKVFKKVDYFFDETKQKMCKCKDIYLLEGSYCDGSTAYLKKCDRNCFFFWHISWIQKI